MNQTEKKLKIRLALLMTGTTTDMVLCGGQYAVNRIISVNYSDYAEKFHNRLVKLNYTRSAYLKALDKLLPMEKKWKYKLSKKFRRKHSDLFVDIIQKLVGTEKEAEHCRSLKKDLFKQHELIKYLNKPQKT